MVYKNYYKLTGNVILINFMEIVNVFVQILWIYSITLKKQQHEIINLKAIYSTDVFVYAYNAQLISNGSLN